MGRAGLPGRPRPFALQSFPIGLAAGFSS